MKKLLFLVLLMNSCQFFATPHGYDAPEKPTTSNSSNNSSQNK